MSTIDSEIIRLVQEIKEDEKHLRSALTKANDGYSTEYRKNCAIGDVALYEGSIKRKMDLLRLLKF